MTKAIDKTGKQFGHWVVLGPAPKRVRHAYWLCVCSCGVEREVSSDALVSGQSKSCGCSRDVPKGSDASSYSHGLSDSTEYTIWGNMRARCTKPSNNRYHNYGGRGIKVCQRWTESFVAFYEDMGPRPSKKHSIDRIDNDGDYEPNNCRWATSAEQGRNTSKNRIVEYKGQRMCLATAAELAGVHRSVAAWRLNNGHPIDYDKSRSVR